MRALFTMLLIHAALLVMASTDFSLINRLWGGTSWQWNYYHISYSSGWGGSYESAFSLGQVLCYVAAYAVGLAVFAMAWTRLGLHLSAVSAFLCLIGLLSFSFEATHWIWAHQYSWIASFPALMAPLWIVAGVQMYRMIHVRAEVQAA